jgi:poly-gamma-glutamate biosynthesis protein PgsC/CapC
MITMAIALGLLLGFIFQELTTVVPGGLVVPGYLALYMSEPTRLAIAFAVALTTYYAVKLLGCRVPLYGQRRIIVTVLLAFVLDWGVLMATAHFAPRQLDAVEAIGHIVPGLLACNMFRNGPLVTVLSSVTVAIAVYLVMLLALGSF